MTQEQADFELGLIVPSRGRPDSITSLREHLVATTTRKTRLVVSVDDDDPMLDAYVGSAFGLRGDDDEPLDALQHDELRMLVLTRRPEEAVVIVSPNSSFVEALNRAALYLAWTTDVPVVAFIGDDNVPRTKGWDNDFLTVLEGRGTGMAYANDLFQGSNLPTTLAMTTDIVRSLGYFGPPQFQHMFVDNVWYDLGTATGCLQYLPETVIEHMHPLAGKGEWTEGHARVNAPESYLKGREAYVTYRIKNFGEDIAKINALLAARVGVP